MQDYVSGQVRLSHTVYDSLGRVLETYELTDTDWITSWSQQVLAGLQLTDVQGEGSRKTISEYDKNGNLIEQNIYDWDQNNWSANPVSEVVYEYNTRSLLVKTTTWRVEKDPDDPLNDLYDVVPIVTHYAYDALGRQAASWTEVRDIDPLNTPYIGNPIKYHGKTTAYDAVGSVILSQSWVGEQPYDPLTGTFPGATCTSRVEHTYNLRNERTTTTDAYGYTTAFKYDPNGSLVELTDKAGYATNIYYDALGRKIAQTDALNNTTTYEYDARGDMVAETLPMGQRYRYQYNFNNQLTTEIDPLGNTTIYQYDSRGRRTAIIDPLGHTTTFTYSDFDQVLTNESLVTFEDDSQSTLTTQYEYDELGRLIRTVSPLGVETQTKYNVLDQAVEVTQAVGTADQTVSQYEYD